MMWSKCCVFLVLLCSTFSVYAQTDKGLASSLDSLQVQQKAATSLLTSYGDSVKSQFFTGKTVAQEYLSAIEKLKVASWKSYSEQVIAESMLLPAFTGQKDLMGSLLKVAKNNKIDVGGIRKKITTEVLKYDIVQLMGEVSPKYEALLSKKKAATEKVLPKMTEPEAIEAKVAALDLATTMLEAYMKKHRLENPRLSLKEWSTFWTELLKDKKYKEVILKGQQGLQNHPKLVEKEKSGSNMRDAFAALMDLQH
jgi:hypothetical protein